MYALARSTIIDTVLGLHILLQHQDFIEGGHRGRLPPQAIVLKIWAITHCVTACYTPTKQRVFYNNNNQFFTKLL